MADTSVAERKTVLAGFHGGSAKVRLTPALPATRVSLRAGADAVAGLSKSLGLKLPTKPKTSASAKGRTAFWIGPDEWFLIDEKGDTLMADCAASGVVHSATDISHRNTAIIVSGPAAADTLNAACPLDLSLAAFPSGRDAHRVRQDRDHPLPRRGRYVPVECWRSFAEYAFGMLAEGAEDASL